MTIDIYIYSIVKVVTFQDLVKLSNNNTTKGNIKLKIK
jgi:hypothetical protein